MVKFSNCMISALAFLSAIEACNGLASTLQRVKNSLSSKERTRDELKIGIAGFYDRSSKLWEDVWGEVSQPANGILFGFLCFLKMNLLFCSQYLVMLCINLPPIAIVAHAPRILHPRRQNRSHPSTD